MKLLDPCRNTITSVSGMFRGCSTLTGIHLDAGVNEETRRKRIENLTIKYRNEYEEKLVVYKKRYAELAKEYEREYNKYRDEYYTLISQSEEKEFEQAYFELMTYDADNQSFLIKSDKQGDILISVPLEEAPSFKQNWNTIKNTITPSFVPSGDDVVLTSVTITNGNKKGVYYGIFETDRWRCFVFRGRRCCRR